MLDVFVGGAGMTRLGRRTEPLADLMAEAAHSALGAAGVQVPDAIVVAAMNPEEFIGDGNFASNIATHMGFAEVPTWRTSQNWPLDWAPAVRPCLASVSGTLPLTLPSSVFYTSRSRRLPPF